VSLAGVRFRLILPSLYLLVAIYVWVDFVRLPPDGLANVGLMLLTLPVALPGLLIGGLTGEAGFILLPDRFGYVANHALYYVPAAAVTALLFWWLGRALDRRRDRRPQA
jgi:hypothetical protein